MRLGVGAQILRRAGEAGVHNRTQVSDQERQSGNGDRGAGLEVVKVAHAVCNHSISMRTPGWLTSNTVVRS